MKHELMRQVEDEGKLGPKMLALPLRQRAFVMSLLENGDNNHSRAARDAGYLDSASINVTAYRLAHDTRVQEAIQEEAQRRLHTGSILAVSEVLKILGNPTTKDTTRIKAAQVVMDRTGLHSKTQHHVTVEHQLNEKEMRDNIRALAQELGLDPAKLLGTVVDAEYEVIESSTEGLEDLL